LIAFQLERDRHNFLMAAEEEVHAEVELESSRVRFEGRSTTVVSVPIGVDYDRIQTFAADATLPQEQQRLRDLLVWTTPRASLSAWPQSMRSWLNGRICRGE
jgi:trehalose-6-phosphate synthase